MLLLIVSCMFCLTSANPIPVGFDFVTQGFGKTYFGSSQLRTFLEAEEHCSTIGAQILKIRSEAELKFLEQVDKRVWIDAENITHWRDGSEMTFSRFTPNRLSMGMNSSDHIRADLRTKGLGRWVPVPSAYHYYTLCEIVHNISASQGYVNLKNLIAKHTNGNTFPNLVNQRFDNIERRLEQMSNVVMNRQGVIEDIRNSISNNTEAMAHLIAKQNSMSESMEDIKRIMAIIYNTLHPEPN